jgi:hypothetical protein
MTWTGIAIGVGAIGAAAISSSASSGAASTEANSANQASQVQEALYAQTEANVAPWLTAGQTSLSKLMAGTAPGGNLNVTPYTAPTMSQFTQDPGYQFQLTQGQDALTNASSLAGGLNSNNLKGLIGYTEGMANTDYQQFLTNYMNQFQLAQNATQQQYANLAGQSAQGLGAGLQQGQIGTQVGQSIGGNIVGAGNASAAGQVGVANALTGALSSGYNSYTQQAMLNQILAAQANNPNSATAISNYNLGAGGTAFNNPADYG